MRRPRNMSLPDALLKDTVEELVPDVINQMRNHAL